MPGTTTSSEPGSPASPPPSRPPAPDATSRCSTRPPPQAGGRCRTLRPPEASRTTTAPACAPRRKPRALTFLETIGAATAGSSRSPTACRSWTSQGSDQGGPVAGAAAGGPAAWLWSAPLLPPPAARAAAARPAGGGDGGNSGLLHPSRPLAGRATRRPSPPPDASASACAGSPAPGRPPSRRRAGSRPGSRRAGGAGPRCPGRPRYRHRLRRLAAASHGVARLGSDDAVDLGPTDLVVLALPAYDAGRLLPGLRCPAFEPILNAHFATDSGLRFVGRRRHRPVGTAAARPRQRDRVGGPGGDRLGGGAGVCDIAPEVPCGRNLGLGLAAAGAGSSRSARHTGQPAGRLLRAARGRSRTSSSPATGSAAAGDDRGCRRLRPCGGEPGRGRALSG